jgi:hypothetical protein
MGYFICLFCALFFSALFLNMKLSTMISLIVYKQDETENSAIASFLVMILAIFFITLFFSIY